jgi:hypothetical protein
MNQILLAFNIERGIDDRLTYVTEHDIRNIMQDASLRPYRLDTEDMVSVYMHVQRDIRMAGTDGWTNYFGYHLPTDSSGSGFSIGNILFFVFC